MSFVEEAGSFSVLVMLRFVFQRRLRAAYVIVFCLFAFLIDGASVFAEVSVTCPSAVYEVHLRMLNPSYTSSLRLQGQVRYLYEDRVSLEEAALISRVPENSLFLKAVCGNLTSYVPLLEDDFVYANPIREEDVAVYLEMYLSKQVRILVHERWGRGRVKFYFVANGVETLIGAKVRNPLASILNDRDVDPIFDGKLFQINQFLDFRQSHSHASYSSFWEPSSYPTGFVTYNDSSIGVSSLIARSDLLINDTCGSEWVLGAGTSQNYNQGTGRIDTIRFYSDSDAEVTGYAVKDFDLSSYDSELIDSLILYADCFRYDTGKMGANLVDDFGFESGGFSCWNFGVWDTNEQFGREPKKYISGDHPHTGSYALQFFSDYAGDWSGLMYHTVGKPLSVPVDAYSHVWIDAYTMELYQSMAHSDQLTNLVGVKFSNGNEVNYCYTWCPDTAGPWKIWYGSNTINLGHNPGSTTYLRINRDVCEDYKAIYGSYPTGLTIVQVYCKTQLNHDGGNGGSVNSWFDDVKIYKKYLYSRAETIHILDPSNAIIASSTLHEDQTGNEASWHTVSFNLTEYKNSIVGKSIKIKFEFGHPGSTESEYFLDNVMLVANFNAGKIVYNGKTYGPFLNKTSFTMPYKWGNISLYGCTFQLTMDSTLIKSIESPSHQMQIPTSGAPVEHTIVIPYTSPINGSGYSNPRVEVTALPDDYFDDPITLRCPESEDHNVTAMCTVDRAGGKITIPASVIDTHGYGVYSLTLHSPNYITGLKTQWYSGGVYYAEDYFNPSELKSIQVYLRSSLPGKIYWQMNSSKGGTSDESSVDISSTSYSFNTLSGDELGQWVIGVKYLSRNQTECGFRTHTFYVTGLQLDSLTHGGGASDVEDTDWWTNNEENVFLDAHVVWAHSNTTGIDGATIKAYVDGIEIDSADSRVNGYARLSCGPYSDTQRTFTVKPVSAPSPMVPHHIITNSVNTLKKNIIWTGIRVALENVCGLTDDKGNPWWTNNNENVKLKVKMLWTYVSPNPVATGTVVSLYENGTLIQDYSTPDLPEIAINHSNTRCSIQIKPKSSDHGITYNSGSYNHEIIWTGCLVILDDVSGLTDTSEEIWWTESGTQVSLKPKIVWSYNPKDAATGGAIALYRNGSFIKEYRTLRGLPSAYSITDDCLNGSGVTYELKIIPLETDHGITYNSGNWSQSITWTHMVVERLAISNNGRSSTVSVTVLWAHNGEKVQNATVGVEEIEKKEKTNADGIAHFTFEDGYNYYGPLTFTALEGPKGITKCLEKKSIERHRLNASLLSVIQGSSGLRLKMSFQFENGQPANKTWAYMLLSQANYTDRIETDSEGKAVFTYPHVILGDVKIKFWEVKCDENDFIVDENPVRGQIILKDIVGFILQFNPQDKEFKTGKNLTASIRVKSIAETITLKDLQIQTVMFDKNGTKVVKDSNQNWPGKLRAGEEAEDLLNILNIPKNLTSGTYTVTLRLKCGRGLIFTTESKEVTIKKCILLTVRVINEHGEPVARVNVTLKTKPSVNEEQTTVAESRTNIDGIASFEVEPGSYQVEIYSGNQKTYEQSIELNTDQTCTLTIENSQSIRLEDYQPPMIGAAVISILFTVLILALRRKRASFGAFPTPFATSRTLRRD